MHSIESNAEKLIAEKKADIKLCDEQIEKLKGDYFLMYGWIRRKDELQKQIDAIESLDNSLKTAFSKFTTEIDKISNKNSSPL